MQVSQLDELYDFFIHAELEYARFKAERTSQEGADNISLKSFGGLPGLVDPSRPGVAYYNRVVLAAEEFDPSSLPPEVQGVEVLMPGQTN